MDRLILRRGLDTCYYRFLSIFAAHRDLLLIVDRRVEERRQARQGVELDRRVGERRDAPPDTWTSADFIPLKGDDQ